MAKPKDADWTPGELETKFAEWKREEMQAFAARFSGASAVVRDLQDAETANLNDKLDTYITSENDERKALEQKYRHDLCVPGYDEIGKPVNPFLARDNSMVNDVAIFKPFPLVFDVTEKITVDKEQQDRWRTGAAVAGAAGAEGPGIKYSTAAGVDYERVSGGSIESYQMSESSTVSAGGQYKLFSAGIKKTFGASTCQESSRHFQSSSKWHLLYSLGLTWAPHKMRSYLEDDFRQALDSSVFKPRDLFNQYGPMYLNRGTWGRKITMHVTADNFESKSTAEMEGEVKAAFTGFFEAGAGEKGKSSTKIKQYNMSESITMSGVQTSTVSFERGVELVSQEMDFSLPVLVRPDTLVPIWALCDVTTPGGQARQKELEEAFSAWADEQALKTVGRREKPKPQPVYRPPRRRKQSSGPCTIL